MPLDELVGLGGARRRERFGRRVTYSPKVFVALTMLCRDRCGYCTFAKAAGAPRGPVPRRPRRSSPSRPPGVTPAATRRCSPSARAPRPATGWRAAFLDDHGYSSTVEYLAAAAAPSRGDRASRPLQRRGAVGRGARAAATGERQPGDDARVARHRPRLPPPRAGQGPGASARDPRGRGAPGDPVHDRGPRRHRRDATRATRRVARRSPTRTARTATSRRCSSRDSSPSPAPRCAPRHRAPLDELRWTVAAARVAPPRRGPRAVATEPRRRPRRARRRRGRRPRRDLAGDDRRGQPGAGLAGARPPRRRYSRPRATSSRRASPSIRSTCRRPSAGSRPAMRAAVLEHADAEGLARDSAWCAGSTTLAPPVVAAGRSSRAGLPAGPVADVLAGIELGDEPGVAEIMTLFSARGAEVRADRRVRRRAAPRRVAATSSPTS